MLEKEEIESLIKREKNNLTVYALYYEEFKKRGLAINELDRRINIHLDRLIELLQRLDSLK